MNSKNLSRSYLETLSTADLISLADNYGIDIPDNLGRRFIIGELLEIAEELKIIENRADSQVHELSELSESEPSTLSESLKSDIEKFYNSESVTLPETFNESEISFVFKNPVWIYVYWDIKNADLKKIENSDNFKNLVIRVSYFDSITSNSPTETFDSQISLADREKFIMVSSNKDIDSCKKYLRIDLVAVYSKGVTDNIAVSKKIELPLGSELLGNAKPGRELEISQIMEISGMKDVLKLHYETHRESFV